MIHDGDQTDVRYLTGTSPTANRSPTSVVTAAGLGKKRNLTDFSWLEWLFLAVSLVNLLATVIFAVYRLVIVIKEKETHGADFTLSILILVNAAFCFYYIISSLLFEMKHEVFVFVVAIVIVVLYCTIDYAVNEKRQTKVKLARLVVAYVMGALNIGFAVRVARQFRWLEFRIVGPVEMLQVIYRQALWFICLLTFDWQLSYSVVVLSVQDVSDFRNHVMEIVVLCCGFFVCPIWALLGWFTVRYENLKLASILAVTGLGAPAYAIYKIVKRSIAQAHDDALTTTASIHTSTLPPTTTSPPFVPDTTTLNALTIATCCLAVIVRVITYAGLIRVAMNFGKGLKEKKRRSLRTKGEHTRGILASV